MEDTQTTLRDSLEAAFDEVNPVEIQPNTIDIEAKVVDDKPRDEVGRFAKFDTQKQEPEQVLQEQTQQELQRPTTWKKEYLPIWDKLATGQAITAEEAKKLAAYSNQRETEYKTGVSTYKAEADAVRSVKEALDPLQPVLQQYGLSAADWIKQAGQAHYTLASGSPQQKLDMLARMARDYNIPLEAVAQHQHGTIDPTVNMLMQQIQQLSGQVNGVKSWQEQAQEAQIAQHIQSFSTDTEKYPYFEEVRGTMAQLLERGLAQDLKTAYDKAIRMQDDVFEKWNAEQLQRQTQPLVNANVVAKAKAAAISPKTTTPSSASANNGAKDRRSQLSEAFDTFGGRV